MKKNEFIIEQLQGYLVADDLADYLDSDIKGGDPVLNMTFVDICMTKEFVVEIANTRAGTRNEYDMFEVTDMCKQLADDGWIIFAKQVGIFKQAKEFFIKIEDANGIDLAENEPIYRYDPEFEQNERYFQEIEDLRELEQEGYFAKV